MSEDKKPESQGPVVVRKGHLRPTPPGEKLEPQVERLEPPHAPIVKDDRPLWQRVAEQRAGAKPATAPGPASAPAPGPAIVPAPGAPRPGVKSFAPRAPRPGGGFGGHAGPGGSRASGGRGERETRETREPRPDRPPAGPVGEPPPAPEVLAPDEGSFEDLLAQSASAPRRRFKVGEKVAGKIIQIGPDVAFLELGSGVAEAMIETIELTDAEGNVTARVADILDAVVVKGGDRGVQVSIGRAKSVTRDHAREALIAAVETGLPVEGIVKAVNKGGIEVEVNGVRAFCPMSQIDVRFVGDATTLVGQKLTFRVQKADDRDVVLSRRVLLEAERAEKAAATRQRLAAGAVFEGTVTSVQDYGAFVDLGGIEGLVHVSELAWDRVSKPQDLLRSGDQVTVTVLRIDEDQKKGERISLSVKALIPRPEPKAAEPRPDRPARPAPPPPPRAGDVVEAAVDKIESFGLFVKFAGGRGLVPASESGTPHGTDLRRAFKVGDAFQALVLQIDEQGRFRLSKSGAVDAAERADARAYMEASKPVGGGKGFGTLGDLLKRKLEQK